MALRKPPIRAVCHYALAGLADWTSLLAGAVLLLNDHVLKAAAPSWWTGKLSDFAGLVFFPFLVLAGLGALEWISQRRFRSPDAAMRLALALTALWFAALKLSPWTQRPALALLEWLTGSPRVLVADPTDLIALAVLPIAWTRWRTLRRRETPQASERSRWRRHWQTLALATAALAALATSPSPTPVDFGMVTGVAADAGNPDVFYAGVATQQILGCKKLRGLGAGTYCEPTAVDRHVETYRTQDGGRTWELYSDVGGYLWADPYTPERLFVLNENGLHRIDGGAALRLNVPITATLLAPYYTSAAIKDNPYALAFDPLTPDALYLAKDNHLYISRDSGETWTDTQIMLDGKPTQIYRLAIASAEPRRIYAAVSYGGIVSSDDMGQSWRVVGVPNWTGEIVIALVVHPQNSSIIYAALSTNIQLSVDGGQTWDLVHKSHRRVQALAIHPTNPDLIYALNYDDSYRVGETLGSDDGGVTWTILNEQGGVGLAVSPLAPHRVVLARDVNGVAVQDALPAPATLTTTTKTAATPRLIYADAFAVATEHPETVYALAATPRVWGVSEDGGQSWITQTLPNHVGEIPETLVAGGRDAAGRELVIAVDRGMLYRFYPQAQGVSVAAQALPPDLRDPREESGARPLLYLSGADRWLLAGPAGVVYSEDDAQTWRTAEISGSLVIAPGILTGTLSWPAALAAAPEGPVYAAVTVAGALEPTQVLLRSDDGASWSIRAWLTQTQMTSLAVHPSAPDIVYGSGGGIYRSGDGGVTWQKCYTSTPPFDGTDTTRILALGERQAWASTAAGIIYSDDDGATWAVVYPVPQLYGPRVFLDAALAPDRSEILLLAHPTLPDTPMPSSALPPIRMRYNLGEGWQTFSEGLPVHFEYHYNE